MRVVFCLLFLVSNNVICWEQASLEDIDALLGCAVCLPTFSCVEFADMSQVEKDLVCRSLFYAINWFVEVVNTFSRCKSAAMRAKVLQRLQSGL